MDLEAKDIAQDKDLVLKVQTAQHIPDVSVTVDGVATVGNVVGGTGNDWEFDPGSRTTITNASLVQSGNTSFVFVSLSRNDELTQAGNIATDNLTIINGTYPI